MEQEEVIQKEKQTDCRFKESALVLSKSKILKYVEMSKVSQILQGGTSLIKGSILLMGAGTNSLLMGAGTNFLFLS